MASGKFPQLTEPYAGYHGIDFAEEFGPQAFVMRAGVVGEVGPVVQRPVERQLHQIDPCTELEGGIGAHDIAEAAVRGAVVVGGH